MRRSIRNAVLYPAAATAAVGVAVGACYALEAVISSGAMTAVVIAGSLVGWSWRGWVVGRAEDRRRAFLDLEAAAQKQRSAGQVFRNNAPPAVADALVQDEDATVEFIRWGKR
jgi:hypothetical protein